MAFDHIGQKDKTAGNDNRDALEDSIASIRQKYGPSAGAKAKRFAKKNKVVLAFLKRYFRQLEAKLDMMPVETWPYGRLDNHPLQDMACEISENGEIKIVIPMIFIKKDTYLNILFCAI